MTALAAPLAIAALVLCVAGVAKLRTPASAGGAMRALGWPTGAVPIRLLAVTELAAGLLALFVRGRAPAAALGTLYALLTAVALLLARRRAACGCFGESDAPASGAHALLSATLALVALAAVLWRPPAAGALIAAHAAGLDIVLMIGILGAVYATVVFYTELPAVWQAWSRR